MGEIEISVGKDRMRGTIRLPPSTGIFAGSKLSFKWENNRFVVEDWPLDGLKLPPFDFENIKGSGKCSQILINLLPIDTEFNLHAGLTITPAQGETKAKLHLKISGTFDLEVSSSAYSSDPLLTANIAETTLDIPLPESGRYEWSELPKAMIDAIKGAAQSIFENLFEDPRNLAKLSAVAGIRWGLAEAIDHLVCRGLSRQAAREAVNAATGTSVATVSACGAEAVKVGGVLAAIVGGAAMIYTISSLLGKAPAKPVTPTLRFDTDTLTIGWEGSSTENVELFVISLVQEGGDTVPVPPVILPHDSLIVTVPLSSLRLGQRYSVQIVACGRSGQSSQSNAASLFLLDRPTRLRLAFDGTVLEANWAEVSGSSGYAVEVLDSAKNPVSPAPSVSIAGTTATIRGGALDAGGTILVRARALAENVLGPWSDEAQVAITVLAAPNLNTLRMYGDETTVDARWDTVARATSYIVQVLDAGGQPLAPQPTVKIIFGTNALISGAGIDRGAQIQVRVKGVAPGAVGTYCTPRTITVPWLLQPTGFTLLYDVAAQTIKAQWVAVPRATRYTLEMRNNQGQRLEDQPPISGMGATTAVFDARGLTPGATYQAVVRAENDTSVGAWSGCGITLLVLPAPTGLSLQRDANKITAKWVAIGDATSYTLELRDAHNTPIEPQPTIEYQGVLANIKQGLNAGATYQAVVRGNARAVIGLWSAPLTVRPVHRWTQVTANGPELPEAPVVLSFENKLWAMAGFRSLTNYEDWYSTRNHFVSSDGEHWNRVGSTPFWDLIDAAGVVHLQRMWVFGGLSTPNRASVNSIVYSGNGSAWYPGVRGYIPWRARSKLRAVVFQEKIWICGGNFSGQVLRDVWCSGDGQDWREVLPSAPWIARESPAVTVFNGQIWMLGGVVSEQASQEVWSTSDGSRWEKKTNAPWPGRSDASAAVLGQTLFLIGGTSQDGTALGDMWSTTDGVHWTQVQGDQPWAPLTRQGVVVHNDALYMLGGSGNGSNNRSVWKYASDA